MILMIVYLFILFFSTMNLSQQQQTPISPLLHIIILSFLCAFCFMMKYNYVMSYMWILVYVGGMLIVFTYVIFFSHDFEIFFKKNNFLFFFSIFCFLKLCFLKTKLMEETSVFSKMEWKIENFYVFSHMAEMGGGMFFFLGMLILSILIFILFFLKFQSFSNFKAYRS